MSSESIARAAAVLFGLAIFAAPALAFEGRYQDSPRRDARTVVIKRQPNGAYAVKITTSLPGCIGEVDGKGAVQGDRLVAVESGGGAICRLTVTSSGDRISVRGSDECRDYGGMRCNEFGGDYRRIGGGAPTQQIASGAPAEASSARGAPYGDWAFTENGRCSVDAPAQGVRIEPTRIIVEWTETTTFSNTYLAGCKDDVCTFRQRGGRSVWTTRWMGADQIAFRGLHSLAGPNNRADNTRSVAARVGSAPGCDVRFGQ